MTHHPYRPATPADLADHIRGLVADVNALPLDADGAATSDGYEKAADALWKAAEAAFSYVAAALGVTGYQASYAALRFYGEVMHIDGPYKIVKAHDALYPQYDVAGSVRSWLDSDDVREWLRDQAVEKLAAEQARRDTTGEAFAVPAVVAHWAKIAQARP